MSVDPSNSRTPLLASTPAEKALRKQITVGQAIDYLRRVGLHDAAERMSRDRQIVVLWGDVDDELGDPRWDFVCDDCSFDTYGHEDIRALAVEHVRETGHSIGTTEKRYGHFKPRPVPDPPESPL